MIINNKKERTRFFRFAIVGAIGAVVDFGVMNLLVNVFKVNFILASIISFLAAVTSNFIWNRFWTYPDSRSKPVLHQLLSFTLLNTIGLIIRTPLIALLEKLLVPFFSNTLILPWFEPAFYAHNLSLATVILVVMLWNFFANRYWTYNDVK